MNAGTTTEPRYMVSANEIDGAPGTFRFSFMPRGLQQVRRIGEPPKSVPMYTVRVQDHGGEITFEWSEAPTRAAEQEELEQLAKECLAERYAWIARVGDLVKHVEKWSGELGWAIRRIERKIDDPRLGNPKVDSLLMQEDTVRVLMEPVSASAPGSDGLVDLYLMPGYDDIANLYYREGVWHVHYVFPGSNAVAAVKAGESRPLSKKTLGAVLGEMKKHAQ